MPYSVGIVFTCVDINGDDLLFPPWLRLEVSTKTETISYDRNGSYAVYCDPRRPAIWTVEENSPALDIAYNTQSLLVLLKGSSGQPDFVADLCNPGQKQQRFTFTEGAFVSDEKCLFEPISVPALPLPFLLGGALTIVSLGWTRLGDDGSGADRARPRETGEPIPAPAAGSRHKQEFHQRHRGALAAPADVEPDRIAVRDGPAAPACDEGGRLSHQRGC